MKEYPYRRLSKESLLIGDSMARKRKFTAEIYPSHVTARTRDGQCFSLPMIDMWDIFSRSLYLMTLSFGVRIHAFVLMTNHFHLLMTSPNDNRDIALAHLVNEVESAIRNEIEDSDPDWNLFEGPCHCTEINNRLYYEYAYKYVYRNPIEARICSRVESYPYSSLRGLLGVDSLPFPAFDNMSLISHPAQKLSWLNSPFPTEGVLENIRLAMKSVEFELDAEKREEKLISYTNVHLQRF